MSIGVTVTDRSREAVDRYREAARFGVDAAAKRLRDEVYKAHNKYYTSRAFRSTVQVRLSIRHENPKASPTGWYAEVGTNKIIALYWELGHHNHFTKKYERVRLWVPTAVANVDRLQRIFARVVARYMQ